MKNKSTRHKDANTFKFQPFAERISNIDIDIFHRVGHENETDCESAGCFFYQAIANWTNLNLTESFNDFKKEVRPHTLVALPQLILEKERVAQVLLKHLGLKNPLCLQPLLDITVAFARDLQRDFYEYYKSFLETLIVLLNTKDTEQLEWIFTCLAYLFKFLWRPFLKDITTVFNTLLPLLSSNRPDYVHSFAAGSFAFVARKVKDWPTFLSHVLKTVDRRKDGIEGCGKLFFEVIHGVSGHFHSCTETVLSFLLSSLGNSKFPQSVLFEILEQVIENVMSSIHPQKNAVLWNSLLHRLDVLLKESKDDRAINEVELVLKLLGQCVEYKGGRCLQNILPVTDLIFKILNSPELPNSILHTVCKIVIVLLLSKNIKLTQEQVSGLVRKALMLPQESILLYFVENVTEFAAFEALVLPSFLTYCLKSSLNTEVFKVVTHLILKKAPPCESGINLLKWKKYAIDFGTRSNNLLMENIILDRLKSENLDHYLSALICLPHLNLTNVDEVFAPFLFNKRSDFLSRIDRRIEEDNAELEKSLFLLNNTVECLIHLNLTNCLNDSFNTVVDTLSPLISRECVWALNIVSLYVTVLRNNPNVINTATLQKLNLVFAPGFNSPYHEIRLVTIHLYTLFEDLPDFDLKHSSDPDVPKEKFQIFSICHKVESIDPQVHTYRQQLQYLEKLNFDKPQMIMCNKTVFRTIPLRYCCGALYMNFKLLWEPIVKIIETHAHGLEVGEFWEIFGKELSRRVQGEEKKVGDCLEIKWDFLRELYEKSGKFTSTPDFMNYRLLLWKAANLFPDVAEAKTRDVSELFLNFVENEYTCNNSLVARKWNIKQNSSREAEVVDEGYEDETIQIKDEKVNSVKIKRGKMILKTLQHFLALFSKMRSPKSMYREPELNRLYLDFLQHKNLDIQRAAFDCLLTYKYKFLMPYKDHLCNLIDDKSFKNELATFHIGKDGNAVQDEHRDELIPLIMRIVFSKMNTKTGLRTGGKSSGQLRRNLVFRFLAGCEEKEMMVFTKMALHYYTTYLQEDPEVMIQELSASIGLESFLPPKRLQSTLNLLNVVLDQFGGLMGNELLTLILQVVVVIGGVLKMAFENISSVHSGYWAILRNLRTSSIKIMERFFSQFDRYPWTNKQINAIFQVFVWPYLNKLSTEGIHSPTSLLKLFVQWGSNPRYFSLLVKHETDRQDQFVLPHIIQLLLNEKSKVSVVNAIEEMMEKLLTLQADEEDLQLVIPIDNLLPISKSILDRIKTNDKLNYGSCILLPYVPSVLELLNRQLRTKSKRLNQRELFILSRISELVWESDVSDKTLTLVLPQILKRANAAEEIVVQMLTTVNNLVNNVNSPRKHLKQLTPLFGDVSSIAGRKLLLQTLKIFDKLDHGMVEGLNAFDSKWINQADFEKRHATFKQVQGAIEAEQVDLELGILLIYNCYYLLKSEKDLSLRENSFHCLKQLGCYLIAKYPKELDYILNDTLFALIRSGMKSKEHNFRNDCILLLGHFSRECPNSHFILRDLSRYINKTDPEVDFFENITHLQLHRHARALLKFCSVTKELTSNPNVRTLTQFVLPLASHYLCNEKFVGKNSVIDAAIECVGLISRVLPWHQYEALLKFYLGQLKKNVEYQKQLVRITVVILDAFHFDLSKAQVSFNEEIVIEAKSEETKDSKSEDDLEDVILNEDALEDEEVSVIEVKICEKVSVLCKSTATRVIRSIRTVLLPELHKTLAELTQFEASHKVNRKKTGFEREEEDLSRVPISLALVKLLQRLPPEILEANLPGIFMKLCTFLKSRLESVRRVTRETLQKIMQTLGPSYLHLLLAEMTPLLNRGFHVHVLVFTVHSVLTCLKPKYKQGDIDKVLLTVLQLCEADLFGTLSEEKEVAKIAVKTSEAKSTKSFDTLQTLAQFITDKSLLDLILPIKNVIFSSNSHKSAHKVQECLRHIALGLADNGFVQMQSLLIFAYGTSSESIPKLFPPTKPQMSEKEAEKLQRERPDCFIIPKLPVGRSGFRVSNVKTSAKTNTHLLIEFGLRLCYVMLKRDKLKDEEYKPYLDPFVGVFQNCLTSKHVKLSTLTLQCLTWIFKYDLPTLRENVSKIAQDMFAILHKYASAGLSKGDNFDLVGAAFKAMSVLVRDVKYHTIESDQLKMLLLYVEQDLHDHDKQATAFNLLKAIIARKLIIPEIHEIMTKVSELSITSELNHVRVQARAVFLQYLMDYPLGEKLETHISFYLSQVSYELQFGRESAIEMIGALISSFPMKTLVDYSGSLFVTLAARLVNDEVPECRKQVSDCITSMITRLDKKGREPLFDVVTSWLRDHKVQHRRLAAQVCGMFVVVEKDTFETRLRKLTPIILKQFDFDEYDDEEQEKTRDHHLFQTLQMLLKLCSNCPAFLKMEEINNLSRKVQRLLGYPHDWVRLSAAQFLGFVLASVDVDDLATALSEKKSSGRAYLRSDPVKEVKSLTLDLCDQLQPGVKSDLAEQVIKNLVFMARVLDQVPDDAKFNLLWLTKRMRRIVNNEIVEKSNSGVLRTEVFKWIAAISTVLGEESIGRIFSHLLAPLVREMITTEESNAPLRQLSKEVASYLKKRVGMETYTKTLSSLQQLLSTRRAERKRSRTQLAVTDPEMFAKKKIKRHEKKKEAKKRKLSNIKGKKNFKRRKVVDLDPEAEV